MFSVDNNSLCKKQWNKLKNRNPKNLYTSSLASSVNITQHKAENKHSVKGVKE